MVYDCPMTENQSVIEEIAMVNCGEKILKFFPDRPLISCLYGPPGLPGSVQQTNPDIYSSIHESGNSIRSNTGKTFAHYLAKRIVMQPLMHPFTHDSEFNDARRLTGPVIAAQGSSAIPPLRARPLASAIRADCHMTCTTVSFRAPPRANPRPAAPRPAQTRACCA